MPIWKYLHLAADHPKLDFLGVSAAKNIRQILTAAVFIILWVTSLNVHAVNQFSPVKNKGNKGKGAVFPNVGPEIRCSNHAVLSIGFRETLKWLQVGSKEIVPIILFIHLVNHTIKISICPYGGKTYSYLIQAPRRVPVINILRFNKAPWRLKVEGLSKGYEFTALLIYNLVFSLIINNSNDSWGFWILV